MTGIWMPAFALGFGAYAIPGDKPVRARETFRPPVVERASAQPVESTSTAPGPSARRKNTRSARLAGASKTTLAAAIEIALLKVPGEALNAEIDLENGKALIEVRVFADGKVFAVEIDGETGSVLEVEEEDEEDEDGDEGDEKSGRR